LDKDFVKAYAPTSEKHDSKIIRAFYKPYARECNPYGQTLGGVLYPKVKMITHDGVPNHHYQITGI
jgi:hypothetical protein